MRLSCSRSRLQPAPAELVNLHWSDIEVEEQPGPTPDAPPKQHARLLLRKTKNSQHAQCGFMARLCGCYRSTARHVVWMMIGCS